MLAKLVSKQMNIHERWILFVTEVLLRFDMEQSLGNDHNHLKPYKGPPPCNLWSVNGLLSNTVLITQPSTLTYTVV